MQIMPQLFLRSYYTCALYTTLLRNILYQGCRARCHLQAPQAKTSTHAASKRFAATREATPSSAAPKNPVLPQETSQLAVAKASANGNSQDVGTQTDFLPAQSSSTQHPAEQMLLAADPAKALAEGTRLLMSGLRGPVTRRQRLLADNAELPTALKLVPWTLLTQSNIQLRLKPAVAAAGTQTEDACQTDEPSVGTIAQIPSAVTGFGKLQGHFDVAGPLTNHMSSPAVQPSHVRTAFAAISNRHSSQLQSFSPAKPARSPIQHRYARSPNAHMMFQSEVRKPPVVTFTLQPPLALPSNSPIDPRHQATACLTPAKTGEHSCRRSSLSNVSAAPAADTPTLVAADIAAAKASATDAAVRPTDPSEIQLTDTGMMSSSCKSASSAPSEADSVVRPSKDPSEIQLTEEALTPSRSQHRARAQTGQATSVTFLPAANPNKAAELSTWNPSDSTDIHSSKAGDAAAIAARPSGADPSSKAAAAVSAFATAAVCKSPNTDSVQGPQVTAGDHAESATQTPAHSHSQQQSDRITEPVIQAAGRSSGSAAAAGRRSPSQFLKASSSLRVSTKKASEALPEQPRQEHSPHACIGSSAPISASSVQQAADPKQSDQQDVMQPLDTDSPKPVAHPKAAAAITDAAAGIESASLATICTVPQSSSQVRTRGKAQPAAEAEKQLGSPGTVDALRTDLVSTAGCHVTRRLVQHLLEPVSRPAKRAASSLGGSSGRAPQSQASKNKASSNSQALQANKAQRSSAPMSHAKAASSSQVPDTPKASGPSAAVDSKGKACSTEQGKQADKGKGKLPAAKNVVIKKQQQSMPPPPATARANQSKPSTHKAATVRLARVSVSQTPESQSRGKADHTRSASDLHKQSTATKPAYNNDKAGAAGNSTAPGTTTAMANKPGKSSKAGKAQASSNDMTTQQDGVRPVAIKPSPSNESKDLQPSYSSASQIQSSLKRQRSDASAASAPAKKHKVSLQDKSPHFLLSPAFAGVLDAKFVSLQGC